MGWSRRLELCGYDLPVTVKVGRAVYGDMVFAWDVGPPAESGPGEASPLPQTVVTPARMSQFSNAGVSCTLVQLGARHTCCSRGSVIF